jgi:hypothetical protein
MTVRFTAEGEVPGDVRDLRRALEDWRADDVKRAHA